jgi:hypothetical protein
MRADAVLLALSLTVDPVTTLLRAAQTAAPLRRSLLLRRWLSPRVENHSAKGKGYGISFIIASITYYRSCNSPKIEPEHWG